MKCTILHESAGHLRIHAQQRRMTLAQADILEAHLKRLPGVTGAAVYDRTCDAVICYRGAREDVLSALARFSYTGAAELAPEHSSRALNREYEDKLVLAVCRRAVNTLFFPMPLRTVITAVRSIHVDKAAGGGRYDRIVKMIEESEKLKSKTEDQASHLADSMVPYSLGATVLIWLITRSAARALAVLMVDFSCTLKLSMPIAVLSAMREAGTYHLSVKGGRFLEAVSQADTIVFDKTGTLTHAAPVVAQVVTFGGYPENDMLRLAACLEEHFPHSMAKAVVAEAARRGLRHEERHSQVQYIVAHGISSSVGDENVVIGSHHFVFEDEGCVVPEDELDKFDAIPGEFSNLYLAISGVLAAVICVKDPLREEAPAVIVGLRKLGITKLVMMTGDNEKTARAVAQAVGVDEYRAEVLPEDKAAFVRSEHALGRKVIMLGDGVNDSPALSEADVGIAISDGAAIAREVADITVAADDLNALLTLKELSDALMRRIHSNYRTIIGFNFMLICLGVAGVLPLAASALLHNTSTLLISLHSMTDLLPRQEALPQQPVEQ